MSTKRKAQAGSNEPPRDLDAIAAEIHQLERSTVFEKGALLAEAQRACEHGAWLQWLDDEFEWSHDTAMNYIAAHELAAKFRTVRNLPIPSRVVYELARDVDDPDLPAIIEALAEVTKGESKSISVSEALTAIRIVKARREYGDYPPAALFAMSLVDSVLPEAEAAQTIAALTEARPTTDEAAAEIVDKFRQATGDDDAGDDDAGDDDAGGDDAGDDEQTDAEAEQPPPRAEIAKLVRAWVQASLGARRQFVRERWDEIARARKELDGNGGAAEDRWIEGDKL
jgi:hypothetical protein